MGMGTILKAAANKNKCDNISIGKKFKPLATYSQLIFFAKLSFMPPIILLFLTTIGFLISSYFTCVSFKWIQPDATWIPSFCQMGKRTCTTIIFTPRASLLGVPNSLMAQFFYAAIVFGLWKEWTFFYPFYYLYLSASFLTVILGLYLSYSLLFLTRVTCKLCFISHGINLAIFLTLLSAGRNTP